MAFLVAPLAAGVVGAVSGTAELYGRGTTTPLFGYSASGAVVDKIIRLDANGGAEVYVGEPAFVRVRSSIGVVVREFVVGGEVDVASASFTGLLPSGSQGAGGVVGLAALLDRWHSSAGASDFLVRRPGIGADETLATALSAVSLSNQPLFNVRNYGAVGDAVTDDTWAFVLAHNAAAVAGGIIFAPGGNYVLNRSWSITSPRVSMMGAGCLATILTIGITAGTAITVNTSAGGYSGSFISDLTIAPSFSGATVVPLQIVASPGFILRNLVVDGFDQSVSIASRAILENCEVYATGVTVTFLAGSAHSVVRGGTFLSTRVTPYAGAAFVFGLHLADTDITVIGAKVDLSAASVGLGIEVLSTRCKVVDCDIIVGGGAASYAFFLATGVGFEFYEDHNTIRGPVAGVHHVNAISGGPEFLGYRGSRVGRIAYNITLAGTVLLDLDYEIQFLNYSLGTSTTVTINAPASGATGGSYPRPGLPTGSKMSLIITNSGAGTATVVLFGRPGVPLATAQSLLATFVWVETGAATVGMVPLHAF